MKKNNKEYIKNTSRRKSEVKKKKVCSDWQKYLSGVKLKLLWY